MISDQHSQLLNMFLKTERPPKCDTVFQRVRTDVSSSKLYFLIAVTSLEIMNFIIIIDTNEEIVKYSKYSA